MTIQEQFGPIDIYLFDQILRGRIVKGMRILDAGCGGGRNLVYFLGEGYDVYGVDAEPLAILAMQALAPAIHDHFRVEAIEAMSYADRFADVVISNAVLHFAADDRQFQAMLTAMWRVLKPGGLLFCRLASSIGIESRVVPVAGCRYALPDGSERYLVDEEMLLRLTDDLRGELLDPIKTTIVQNQRSMTTWVVRKHR